MAVSVTITSQAASSKSLRETINDVSCEDFDFTTDIDITSTPQDVKNHGTYSEGNGYGFALFAVESSRTVVGESFQGSDSHSVSASFFNYKFTVTNNSVTKTATIEVTVRSRTLGPAVFTHSPTSEQIERSASDYTTSAPITIEIPPGGSQTINLGTASLPKFFTKSEMSGVLGSDVCATSEFTWYFHKHSQQEIRIANVTPIEDPEAGGECEPIEQYSLIKNGSELETALGNTKQFYNKETLGILDGTIQTIDHCSGAVLSESTLSGQPIVSFCHDENTDECEDLSLFEPLPEGVVSVVQAGSEDHQKASFPTSSASGHNNLGGFRGLSFVLGLELSREFRPKTEIKYTLTNRYRRIINIRYSLTTASWTNGIVSATNLSKRTIYAYGKNASAVNSGVVIVNKTNAIVKIETFTTIATYGYTEINGVITSDSRQETSSNTTTRTLLPNRTLRFGKFGAASSSWAYDGPIVDDLTSVVRENGQGSHQSIYFRVKP
jgi:hypothetical protein